MTFCKLGLLILGWIASMEAKVVGDTVVWLGTRGKAIYRAQLDEATGKISTPQEAAQIKSPGFVCLNKAGDLLYSLGTPEGTEGNVAVYRVGTDSKLSLLNTSDSECGKGTHLSLSQDERTLLVAHYGSGKVASLPVEDDGSIGPPKSMITHTGSGVNKDRQSEAHPHWIGVSPDGKYAMVPDLGMDQVVVYSLDSSEHALTHAGEGKVPAGEGPRHLKFHPNGQWAYVINELGLTVTGFHYDSANGSLTPFQTAVALPMDEVKDVLTSGSEIRMHPNGKFLYAGIRGHDVIVVFEIGDDGTLKLVEREPIRGSWPRNFGISPTGKWLLAAGAESNSLSVFRVDPASGRLTFTRNVVPVPQCICVEFQP